MTKKRCTKCGRMLPFSEFNKNKNTKDGLQSWCKECEFKYKKEKQTSLKLETMNAFGGRCVHIENGIRCPKNSIDNLDKLETSHPNGDGDEHRDLISKGQYGQRFYQELKNRNWNTDGFVVEVRCNLHHLSFDHRGKRYSSSKKGKFNDPGWLEEKYKTMSLEEIATLCGVSVGTIRNRMIEFNLLRRKPWQRP